MKPWLKWTLGVLIVSGYVACSPKQFSSGGCEDAAAGCIVTPSGLDYEQVVTVEGGKVDILVVDDNSASMSYEQNQLASRFNGFIAKLEAAKIDYRVAVTTTDISGPGNEARAVNKNGALQDGRLIPFDTIGGAKFLTKASGGGVATVKDNAFKSVVKRPETLACEQFIINWVNSGKSRQTTEYQNEYYANCPSGDERGIYAARMVMENNPDGFLRSDADLAIIFLSDEDERSANYRAPYPGSGEKHSCLPGDANCNSSFMLSDYDKADSFKAMMASKYPSKAWGAHAFIVKHGDTACLNTQNNQTLGIMGGSYGIEYSYLRSYSNGIERSICESDYATPLADIFNNVQGKIVDKISLKCSAATNLSVDFISGTSVSWTLVGSEVRFSQKLAVGTSVRVRYSCPGAN